MNTIQCFPAAGRLSCSSAIGLREHSGFFNRSSGQNILTEATDHFAVWPMSSKGYVSKFRRIVPITRSAVFLNHAETSPMLTPVARAMGAYLKEKFQALDTSSFISRGCPRALIAKLIGASEDEICYAPNTSYGINIAANGLRLGPSNNVVLWDLEFPGNLYPWLRQRNRGAEIRWLHGRTYDLSELEKLVDHETAVVPVSHVNWMNGYKPDLKQISEIVHKAGGYLFVDATQSAGAMSIDVKRMGIDILACAFYKWLLGPSGAGFLYVREDLVEELAPPFIGWNAVKNTGPPSYIFNPKEIEPQDRARRYLPGSMSPIPFMGAGVSLNLLLDVGIDRIEKRILDLTDRLTKGLKSVGLDVVSPQVRSLRGGIVNFNVAEAPEVAGRLSRKKILVSARSQEGVGGIRVSPHFYNTEREIDELVKTVPTVVSP
jgi:cysteine desulfurase/selenocysteine lyase